MKHVKAMAVLVAALAAMPAASYAQLLAYTSTMAKLRAGPDRNYPVVAVLPAGMEVSVFGCLGDYRWCDVAAGFDRGWLYAGNIVYPFGNANVPLLSYGPTIGIGIVAFDLGHYWGRHYRARPWYPHRHRWIERQGPGFGQHDHRAPPQDQRPGFIVEQPPWHAHRPPPIRHHGFNAPPRPPPGQAPMPPRRPPPVLGPAEPRPPQPHPQSPGQQRPGPHAIPGRLPPQGNAPPRPHGPNPTRRPAYST